MLAAVSAKGRNAVALATLASSYPIVVEKDPTLKVWSTVRLPRKDDRVCLIAYHPQHAKYLDYLIAHECGHIYRFFSANPEDRLVSVSSSSDVLKAKQELAKESWKLKDRIPKGFVDELFEMLFYGLVRQLTNTPADCRIEIWLDENFPELRDVQASALRELYSTSLQCLYPEIQKWTPPSIYKNSNAMNYVLAKASSRLLDEPEMIEPYVHRAFAELGEKLNSYLSGTDGGHIDDIRVADAWARELRIAGWYHWKRLD